MLTVRSKNTQQPHDRVIAQAHLAVMFLNPYNPLPMGEVLKDREDFFRARPVVEEEKVLAWLNAGAGNEGPAYEALFKQDASAL